ncbi:hypothetical protein IWZ01DRAFT_543748 [Phyllosticta capitalensis]
MSHASVEPPGPAFLSQRKTLYSQPTSEDCEFERHFEFGLRQDWESVDPKRVLKSPKIEDGETAPAEATEPTGTSQEPKAATDEELERRRKTSHASFGSDATTATANAYGKILQISAYLGPGTCGFFCVDLVADQFPPFFVDTRARDLYWSYTDPHAGLGLFGSKQEDQMLDFIDDHWPRYRFKANDRPVTLNYVVKEGLVVQNYIIGSRSGQNIDAKKSEETYEESEDQTLLVVKAMELRIRDLHWASLNGFNSEGPTYPVDPDDKEESASESDDDSESKGSIRSQDQPHYSGYETFLGPRQCSIITVHHFSPEYNNDSMENRNNEEGPSHKAPQAVGLVMSLFLNGKVQETDGEVWKVPLDSPGREATTVTIVYRLQLMMSEDNGWRSTVISASDVFGSSFYPDAPSSPVRLSDDDRLDFVFRRNLAHIFFAFRFLLEISKVLGQKNIRTDDVEKSQPTDQEAENAREYRRTEIIKTCRGHLLWVYRWAWPNDSALFKGSHWASGRVIKFSSWMWRKQAPEPLSNTPFQIIKAVEFITQCVTIPTPKEDEQGKTHPDDFHPRLIETYRESLEFLTDRPEPTKSEENQGAKDLPHELESVEDNKSDSYAGSDAFVGFDHFAKAVQRWIHDLASKNKRGEFAFHRSQENGVGKFRLEDHVWIWTALRCIEEIGLPTDPDIFYSGSQAESMTSKSAQKNMLRRFTVEDSSIKQRMLATSRSVLENRFLFRCRDTALIYASFLQFFETDRSRLAAWQNTISIQRRYEHNDESTWEKSLRYGLAMLMCSNNKWQINEKSPESMFFAAKDTLLASCGVNGLCPGQIDERTGEAEMYTDQDDRDSYWAASFELPYILWILREKTRRSHEIWKPTTSAGLVPDITTGSPVTKSPEAMKSSPNDPERFEGAVTTGDRAQQDVGAKSRAAGDLSAVRNFFATKSAPVHYLLDQDSILDVNDPWLYRYPDFLDFTPELPDGVDGVVKWLGNWDGGGRRAYLYDGFFQEGIDAIVKLYPDGPAQESPLASEWEYERLVYFIDIPKASIRLHTGRHALQIENIDRWYHRSNGRLLSMLAQERTERRAKKRLIWLTSPRKDLAALFMFASPQEEELFDFFRRHFGYEKFFFDEVITLRNNWETELHLSFYQLIKDGKHNGNATPDYAPYLQIKGRRLAQAAIGFRFDGDFLDRFWTCHVVENLPVRHGDPDRVLDPFSKKPPKDWAKAWPQRKVLELMILDKILFEISDSTTEILKEFEDLSGIRSSGHTITGDYFSSADQWNALVYGLTRVEEDLAGNLETLQGWRNREADRGTSRPRWTKNDEGKYRTAIDAMVRSNKQKFRRLNALHARIQNLQAKIESFRGQYRDDLNLRSAEDTRIFTNVTVIFLPLGFATGIFSMNGAPAHDLLVQTISTAIVALVLTALVLKWSKANAGLFKDVSEFLDAMLRFPVSFIRSSVRKSKEKSILYKHYHESKPPRSSGGIVRTREEETSIKWQLERASNGMWHLWYWISYLTQEIPLRQLTLAHESWQATEIWKTNHTSQPLSRPGSQGTGSSRPSQSLSRPGSRGTETSPQVNDPEDETGDASGAAEISVNAEDQGIESQAQADVANGVIEKTPTGEAPTNEESPKSQEAPGENTGDELSQANQETRSTRLKQTLETLFMVVIVATVAIIGLPIWLLLILKSLVLTGRLWQPCKLIFHLLVFLLLVPLFVPVFLLNLLALNVLDVFRLVERNGLKKPKDGVQPSHDGAKKSSKASDGSSSEIMWDEDVKRESPLEKLLIHSSSARPFKDLEESPDFIKLIAERARAVFERRPRKSHPDEEQGGETGSDRMSSKKY